MDFVSDRLADGKRLRVLTVVDHFDRSCPILYADHSIGAGKVADALDRAAQDVGGLPEVITVDNGPKFAGNVLDAWAYNRGINLNFISPGRPTENSFIESFNGKLRDELLNTEIFFSLSEAREKLEAYRLDYNTIRPHSSLGLSASGPIGPESCINQIQAEHQNLTLLMDQWMGEGHLEVAEGGAEALTFVQGMLVDAQIEGAIQADTLTGLSYGELLVDKPDGGLSDLLIFIQGTGTDALIMLLVGVVAEGFGAVAVGPHPGSSGMKLFVQQVHFKRRVWMTSSLS